jgi:hypothetical protein
MNDKIQEIKNECIKALKDCNDILKSCNRKLCKDKKNEKK